MGVRRRPGLLAHVAREWYDKQAHTWVAKHADSVKHRLEIDLFPKLGKYPIDQIDAPELLDTIGVIEKRGAFDLAHRVLQLANQIFRYGIAKKLCTRGFHELRDALHSHKKQSQSAIRPEELPILLHAITGYEKIGDRRPCWHCNC